MLRPLLATTLAVAAAPCGCSTTAKTTALRPLDPAAMRKTVESLAKELLVPGAVVLLSTPHDKFEMLYGVTTFAGRTPVDYDLHVRIGSNTKTWIGSVILQQVDEGLIKLTDPVSKFRPDVLDKRGAAAEGSALHAARPEEHPLPRREI